LATSIKAFCIENAASNPVTDDSAAAKVGRLPIINNVRMQTTNLLEICTIIFLLKFLSKVLDLLAQ
jgi:hypothetical protein